MEMTITISELFLGVWAIAMTALYGFERSKAQEFKFRTAVIMKALAEGKAKFIKDSDGDFQITATQGE